MIISVTQGTLDRISFDEEEVEVVMEFNHIIPYLPLEILEPLNWLPLKLMSRG